MPNEPSMTDDAYIPVPPDSSGAYGESADLPHAEAPPAGTDNRNEEDEDHSAKVERRIGKLTKARRDEERRAVAAEARAAALEARIAEMERSQSAAVNASAANFEASVSAREAIAKQRLQQAIEVGDVEGQVNAVRELSAISVDVDKLSAWKRANAEKPAASGRADDPVARPVRDEPAPGSRTLSPRGRRWVEENGTWFNRDNVMTAVAIAVDKEVQDEGFDPGTDEYFDEIDARLRRSLPHKFGSARPSGASVGSPQVAGASRASTGGGKRVKLSAEQVAAARQLGVDPAEYAKYVE